MYRAFNLKLDNNLLGSYREDRDKYEKIKEEFKDNLIRYIDTTEVLSAKKLKQYILPTADYDIFISHSHNDLDLALRLKSFLEKFKLRVFIDSLYWLNITELQEKLNSYHYNARTQLFDHATTMRVAEHCNMILASALSEMIDRCECVFFLNTDNSIASSRQVVDGDTTYSPWIYHEVYTTTIVKQHLDRVRTIIANESLRNSFSQKRDAKLISYDVDLSNMELVDIEKLRAWSSSVANNATLHPLDLLYNID